MHKVDPLRWPFLAASLLALAALPAPAGATPQPVVTTAASLPIGVVGAAAAVGRNGEMLVIGGLLPATNAYSAQLFAWDALNGAWAALPAALPVPFAFGGCSRVDALELIHCFGGETARGITNASTTFDAFTYRPTVRWEDFIPLSHFGAVRLVPDLWVIVGGEGPFAAVAISSMVAYAKPHRRTGQPVFGVKPSLERGVRDPMCTTTDGRALCCGGVVNDTATGLVTAVDTCWGQMNATVAMPDFEAWVLLPPLPQPRARGCCATLPAVNTTCCFGGIGVLGNVLNTVDCFNRTNQTWSTLSVTTAAREYLSCAAALPNVIRLVGGRDALGTAMTLHEVFTLGTVPPCRFRVNPATGACDEPTYRPLPLFPSVGQAFEITLPYFMTPPPGRQLWLRLAGTPDCLQELPGLPDTLLNTPLTPDLLPGAVFVSSAAYTAVYVCYRSAAVAGWTALPPSPAQQPGWLSFAISLGSLSYVAYPARPQPGEPFQLTIARGALAAPQADVYVRLAFDPSCTAAPGQPPVGAQLQRAGDDLFGVLRLDPAPVVWTDEVVVCVQQAGGWRTVDPLVEPLRLQYLVGPVRSLATGTAAAAASVVALLVGVNPAGLSSTGDLQVLAMLGEFDCAPVTVKSYTGGSGWLLHPFGGVPLTDDRDFNNVVGSLLFLVGLGAVHAAVVLLTVEHRVWRYGNGPGGKALLRRRQPPDAEDGGGGLELQPSLSLEPASSMEPNAMERDWIGAFHQKVKAKLLFPKLELLVALFLYQGFALSAVKVMSGRTVGLVDRLPLAVTVGVFAFIAVPLGFVAGLVLFVNFTLRPVIHTDSSPVAYAAYGVTLFGEVVARVPWPFSAVLPSHYWRSMTGEFMALYGPVISDFNLANYPFMIVYVLRSLALAVVIGPSGSACEARVAVSASVLALAAVLLAWRRPHRAPGTNVLRTLLAALHALVTFVVFFRPTSPVLEPVLAVISALLFLDLAWLVTKTAHHVWNTRRINRVERGQEAPLESPEQPLPDVSAVPDVAVDPLALGSYNPIRPRRESPPDATHESERTVPTNPLSQDLRSTSSSGSGVSNPASTRTLLV